MLEMIDPVTLCPLAEIDHNQWCVVLPVTASAAIHLQDQAAEWALASEISYTAYINDDVYSPMKAENTQLQETEWTEDRQTY